MMRFGKSLGTLDLEVNCIKLMNDADPAIYNAILNGDENAEQLVNELFEKNPCNNCKRCKK